MTYFSYRNQQLFIENINVHTIAEQYGTPTYIYSRAALEKQWLAFDQAFANHAHLICYAVKANSNLAVLNLLARLGSGFDIVSVGELERVLAAGGNPKKIVFSGVGKQTHEIKRALEIGILCFNVESAEELQRINQIAHALNKRAPISLRINPNVDAKTHRYIATGLKENKFGIDIGEAKQLYLQAATLKNLEIIGIDCHIGSQLVQLEPFIEALDHLLQLIDDLAKNGITIQHVDLGGGLGVTYHNETPPTPEALINAILQKVQQRNLTLILEPGRSIVANAGFLLTRVEYLKHASHKNFAIIDAAMNDLLRPALYDAWHNILPAMQRDNAPTKIYDIVGPVCETGDWLAKDRQLHLQQNDLLVIQSVGAYGFILSSNYNSRPRAAEIMIDNDKAYLVRKRETVADLFALETILL